MGEVGEEEERKLVVVSHLSFHLTSLSHFLIMQDSFKYSVVLYFIVIYVT